MPTTTAHTAAIRIVIAYETAAIAVRAKEISERLAAELQAEYASWRLDLLAQPALCRQAATAVSEADMIIIAACGTGKMPNHAKIWIETWLPQKNNKPAVLVLLPAEESESPTEPPLFYNYLRQVAETRNMDFFCSASHWMLRDFPQTEEIIPRGRRSKLTEEYSPELAGKPWASITKPG